MVIQHHDLAPTEDTVRAVIAALAPTRLERAPEPGDAVVDDLGYHSLAIVELGFALEELFELEELSNDTAAGFVTVGDIAGYIAAEVEAGRGRRPTHEAVKDVTDVLSDLRHW